mmetsp:Transcript_41997/g.100977  ORF Transcript_41997/g.100977 Transcript_41997/m.100977 type:complete len:215 (-) Transcript_41997:2355-2999(-)
MLDICTRRRGNQDLPSAQVPIPETSECTLDPLRATRLRRNVASNSDSQHYHRRAQGPSCKWTTQSSPTHPTKTHPLRGSTRQDNGPRAEAARARHGTPYHQDRDGTVRRPTGQRRPHLCCLLPPSPEAPAGTPRRSNPAAQSLTRPHSGLRKRIVALTWTQLAELNNRHHTASLQAYQFRRSTCLLGMVCRHHRQCKFRLDTHMMRDRWTPRPQ